MNVRFADNLGARYNVFNASTTHACPRSMNVATKVRSVSFVPMILLQKALDPHICIVRKNQRRKC